MKQMLGERIYELRKKRGLTQAQLGDFVGVSNKAVSKWETDEANPEINLIPKIAQALGVSVNCLFGGEDQQAQSNVAAKQTLASNPEFNNYMQMGRNAILRRLRFQQIYGHILFTALMIGGLVMIIFGVTAGEGNYRVVTGRIESVGIFQGEYLTIAWVSWEIDGRRFHQHDHRLDTPMRRPIFGHAPVELRICNDDPSRVLEHSFGLRESLQFIGIFPLAGGILMNAFMLFALSRVRTRLKRNIDDPKFYQFNTFTGL